ncbi:hypothetical protein C8J57DRAFT_1240684 [Mycena rebaudengoi]|nr:hypothetical protein C8J57DRAFT_1240684 [Mycena rebaudengoi]
MPKKKCYCRPTCGKEVGRRLPPDSDSNEGSSSDVNMHSPSLSSHSDLENKTSPITHIPDAVETISDIEMQSDISITLPHSPSPDFDIGFGDDDWDELQMFNESDDADAPISLEQMQKQVDDMLFPDEEAELWDAHRDNIRAFKFDLISKIPRRAYEHMRYTFRHKLEVSSHWQMLHRITVLSGVEPVWYNCCINSCMAYTRHHKHRTDCQFCQESRHNSLGKPRRLFCYLPIIPRLQGFFINPKKVEALLYRHNYVHNPDKVSDVFDGQHYRSLLTKKVVVDGKELSHRYFSGKYDIALGICIDSYLLFQGRRKGPSATPILIKNYNIRPDIRTHLDESMCAGYSTLRGYNLFGLGDIIALEKIMNIKGHNGFCPCRSCEIKGARNIAGHEKIYYVPLTHPDGRVWVAESIGDMAIHQNEIAFNSRIKGLPTFHRVGSLDFARSFPWDLMHLLFENIIPILIFFWLGKFKKLDVGDEDYEISAEIWEEIWAETVDAVKDIPADFVRSMTNGPGTFNTEAWCFWFVYLALILLNNRFRHRKYHKHLCDLSEIIKLCLSFTLTHTQIDDLEVQIISWARTYEEYVHHIPYYGELNHFLFRYYYQFKEEWLSACLLTIHGLLHTFWMERYCGFLKAALRSKKSPWANLINIVLKRAYLEQLDARYDVANKLSTPWSRKTGLASTELPPYDGSFCDCPVDELMYRTQAFAARSLAISWPFWARKMRQKDVEKELPEIMPSWGKVRIIDGDSIRTASASGNGTQQERNTSFMRYCISTETPQGDVTQLFYGQLQEILVCKIPDNKKFWKHLSGSTCLLAVIIPCSTGGADAAQGILLADSEHVEHGGMIKPEFIPSDEGITESDIE